MLSFLKKKTDAATTQAPAWHPNFRNYERLPDIKVVRTAFFVNGAAAFIAIGLAAYLAYSEYELLSLKKQLADAEAQIETDSKDSAKMVGIYNKFKEEESRVLEVDAFVKSKPPPSDVLQRLAETRPENIAFEQILINETGITIRGAIKGSPEEGYNEAAKYQALLRDDKVLNSRFEEVVPKQVSPNPTTGRLVFEIYVRFKPEAAPKK